MWINTQTKMLIRTTPSWSPVVNLISLSEMLFQSNLGGHRVSSKGLEAQVHAPLLAHVNLTGSLPMRQLFRN